jgi:hypothetical protein
VVLGSGYWPWYGPDSLKLSIPALSSFTFLSFSWPLSSFIALLSLYLFFSISIDINFISLELAKVMTT